MFSIKLSRNIGPAISSNYYYPRKNTFKVIYDPTIYEGVEAHNESVVTIGRSFDEMVLFELLIDAGRLNMHVYAPTGTSEGVLDDFERIHREYREVVTSKDEEPAYA